jgi:hypothetical protein
MIATSPASTVVLCEWIVEGTVVVVVVVVAEVLVVVVL